MPFNGSGVFSRVYNWVSDKNSAIPITASRADTEDDGFATGLSNVICRDGQTTITANLPMTGFIHTGVGNASARTHYAVVGQIQDSTYNWVAGGGTADVITATYSPAVTALVDGMELSFRASAPNATTTPTFSPNGLTARTITQNGGSALSAGSIPAAAFEAKVRYNLANTRWELQNPAISAPFVDTTAIVKGSADATKKMRLEVDGLTTGTTRVVTVQDADGTMAYSADITTAIGAITSNAAGVLKNAGYYVNQLAPATNADDTYGHDCWYALTQSGAIAITTVDNAEDTTPKMARLTQSQASAQRMGYAQIIEGRDCKFLRGQQVTLKLRYRCSSSQAIRFGILEWTGTEDTVTSDVVNDWTSSTYTASNFFIAASVTPTSVAAATPSANTLTDYTVTATLGSSFNNLIFFVWTEGTAAQNVTLDLGKVKLERGSTATRFEPNPYGEELRLCQRYLPVHTAQAGADASIAMGQCYNTTNAYIHVPWPVDTRIECTGITVSNAAHFAVFTAGGGSAAASAVTFSQGGGLRGAGVNVTVASGLVAGSATMFYTKNASAQLYGTGAQL